MSLRPRPASAPPAARSRLEQVLFAGLNVAMPGGRGGGNGHHGGGKGKMPAAPKPPPPSWWTSNGNAFLWVVAEGGVGGIASPAVLLIGERHAGKSTVLGSRGRLWNVPGGGAKGKDNDQPRLTALREFTEETGADIFKLMKAVAGAKLVDGYTSKSKKTRYYILHVPATAEVTSLALGLTNTGKDRITQMDTPMSTETKGWVWVTKDALIAAGKTGAGQPSVKIGRGYEVQLRSAKTARTEILAKM